MAESHTFTITWKGDCPECGPNGTNPIQSLYDFMTKPPCETCKQAVFDAIGEHCRLDAVAAERAVFDRILQEKFQSDSANAIALNRETSVAYDDGGLESHT